MSSLDPRPRASSYWPLNDLVLSVGDLVMRPLAEEDLDYVATLLPHDLAMNPHTPRPFGLDEPRARGVAMRQEYWKTLGSWSPDDWEIGFGAWMREEFVGSQALEANDFAVLRTVETASWLRTEFRGRGLGKLMRVAVLSLAFDRLDALVALTEAWSDNHASLGVSRALGYRPNGSARHRLDGGVAGAAEMPRMRMDLADWRAVARPNVRIEGLEPCLPFLVAEVDSVDDVGDRHQPS